MCNAGLLAAALAPGRQSEEMTTLDLTGLTETELLELRIKTNDELGDLRGFISTAKTYHARTGSYYNPQKFAQIQRERQEKASLISKIDLDKRRRREQRAKEHTELIRQKNERRAKGPTIEAMFIRVAKEKLTGEVFSQIMSEAKARVEDEL